MTALNLCAHRIFSQSPLVTVGWRGLKLKITGFNLSNNEDMIMIRQDTPKLRQDPLEAILVIFGRRTLIFFLFESSWKKWKSHSFCAHAQWWSPWRRKNVEKGHLAPSTLTFLLIAIDTNGFRRMKEEGQIYKGCLRFFNFCLGI